MIFHKPTANNYDPGRAAVLPELPRLQLDADPTVASAKPAPIPAAPADTCTPELRKPKDTPALALRSKGIDALASGKAQVALKAFYDAMELVPNDVVSFALHTAATADLSEERMRSGRSFGRLKPVVVDSVAPPHKTLSKATAAPKATLTRDGEEPHFGDFFGWVTTQGLTNPIEFGVNGEVPAIFGPAFGEQLGVRDVHEAERRRRPLRAGPAGRRQGGRGSLPLLAHPDFLGSHYVTSDCGIAPAFCSVFSRGWPAPISPSTGPMA